MTAKDFLNEASQANFLIGKFMVWKHEQGWSATNIKTGEYFEDFYEWRRNKQHLADKTGRNYWEDIDTLLVELEKEL
jgi:hypothetical protein